MLHGRAFPADDYDAFHQRCRALLMPCELSPSIDVIAMSLLRIASPSPTHVTGAMRSSSPPNRRPTVKCGSNASSRAGRTRAGEVRVANETLRAFSYNRLLSMKEEIEQKYLHLSQVYESEAKTKYQYLQQVEELSAEVRELRREVENSWRGLAGARHVLLAVISLSTSTSSAADEEHRRRRLGGDSEDQEGAEPLSRLALSTTMETDRRGIHSVCCRSLCLGPTSVPVPEGVGRGVRLIGRRLIAHA